MEQGCCLGRMKVDLEVRGPAEDQGVHVALLPDRLLMNSVRYQWGLSMTASCPRCHVATEDSLYAPRDCKYAMEVWLSFSPTSKFDDFSLGLKE